MKLALATVIVALSTLFALAQTGDPTGTWAGPLATDAGPGGLEITLSRDDGSWKAAAKFRLEGEELAPPALVHVRAVGARFVGMGWNDAYRGRSSPDPRLSRPHRACSVRLDRPGAGVPFEYPPR